MALRAEHRPARGPPLRRGARRAVGWRPRRPAGRPRAPRPRPPTGSGRSRSGRTAAEGDGLGHPGRVRLGRHWRAQGCRVGCSPRRSRAWGMHVEHALQALDRPRRRPGRVEDDGVAADAGHRPGQASERVDQPHGLGQARRLAFEDLPGALRGLVPRPEAGTAGGHDQAGEAGAQPGQLAGHRRHPVRDHRRSTTSKPAASRHRDQGRPGAVLAGAGDDAVGHRDHLGLIGAARAHRSARPAGSAAHRPAAAAAGGLPDGPGRGDGIRMLEDGAAGHERVGPGLGHLHHGVGVDTAVDFDGEVEAVAAGQPRRPGRSSRWPPA